MHFYLIFFFPFAHAISTGESFLPAAFILLMDPKMFELLPPVWIPPHVPEI